MKEANINLSGFRLYDGYLSTEKQNQLVAQLREIVKHSPLYVPVMPGSGQPMSVRMTSCGKWGWYSDKAHGYRYIDAHPDTGKSWTEIPKSLVEIWHDLTQLSVPCDTCLLNFYTPDAKMGLHQDSNEEDYSFPIVSFSLGDSCLFRLGGNQRKDKTRSFKLHSGDICVLADEARMFFHGVDRIYPDTSTLLENGGRINITLRRAKLAE